MDLTYRPHATIEDLAPGECTMRRTGADGKRWWTLWMNVYREDQPGTLIDIAVPVTPNGTYAENGPGGRTWGLTNNGGGRWAVSPSVDAKSRVELVPGHAQDPRPSIWHQNPVMVDVPDGEEWQSAAP